MGKKLAIKGHSTRGNEVIELLGMMGGKEPNDFKCSNPNKFYYILNEYICWDYIGPEEIDKYTIFTLEEFWEKYPFKIGDKVIDEADGCPGVVCEMKWDEGLSDMKYCVSFGNGIDFGWFANDSINYFKINKNENLEETQTKRDIDKAEFMIKHMILPNKMDDKLEYEIIDGYEFDKVENGKIILKPIKTEYPKTYKECCDVLFIPPYYNLRYHTYERGYNEYATSNTLLSLQDKLNTLGKLLICRKAYYKIAGEEMGLDKPWEPKRCYGEEIFFIYCDRVNGINIGRGFPTDNYLLTFPTVEMRDAFYKNFKDLIETCKELL